MEDATGQTFISSDHFQQDAANVARVFAPRVIEAILEGDLLAVTLRHRVEGCDWSDRVEHPEIAPIVESVLGHLNNCPHWHWPTSQPIFGAPDEPWPELTARDITIADFDQDGRTLFFTVRSEATRPVVRPIRYPVQQTIYVPPKPPRPCDHVLRVFWRIRKARVRVLSFSYGEEDGVELACGRCDETYDLESVIEWAKQNRELFRLIVRDRRAFRPIHFIPPRGLVPFTGCSRRRRRFGNESKKLREVTCRRCVKLWRRSLQLTGAIRIGFVHDEPTLPVSEEMRLKRELGW